MNKHQKAINRYTKQSMKWLSEEYGYTEPFRITRVWNREDLKEFYGKQPSIETLNRLTNLNKKI